MVRIPDTAPDVVGVKSIVSWQVEFAASVDVPQVLLAIANGGVMEMLDIGMALALEFITLTDMVPDVTPTSELPRFRALVLSTTTPAGVPVPFRYKLSCPP
jgi:hypothetical protein